MKYENENCEKKTLMGVGIGNIKMKMYNATGNRTNTKDRSRFLNVLIEKLIYLSFD